MELCPTLKIFTKEESTALLTFTASLKNTFDKFGVSEGKAVQVLVYLQSNVAREVYKAYDANRMSIDAHVYYGTLPVALKALI